MKTWIMNSRVIEKKMGNISRNDIRRYAESSVIEN